jgi:hypothetical protein
MTEVGAKLPVSVLRVSMLWADPITLTLGASHLDLSRAPRGRGR